MKIQFLLLSLIMLAMFAIPIVQAVATDDISYFYKIGNNYDIKRECYTDGYPCDLATYGCNLTVYYPNNTIYKNDSAMTGQSSFWNYSVYPTNEPQGVYRVAMYCTNGTHSGREIFYYTINTTGYNAGNTLFYIFAGTCVFLFVVGLFKEVPWFGAISGFMFMALAVYVFVFGLSGMTDDYSRYVGYALFGVGIIAGGVGAYTIKNE
jgi:hypothetical protein